MPKNLVNLFQDVPDSEIIKNIIAFLPVNSRSFNHLAFNFALYKITQEYPRLFKTLYFRATNKEDKKYYSGKLEDIKFMFGVSGVMDIAMGNSFQYMNIDGKMVAVLKKETTEELTKEQMLGVKILSRDFVNYLKKYSN